LLSFFSSSNNGAFTQTNEGAIKMADVVSATTAATVAAGAPVAAGKKEPKGPKQRVVTFVTSTIEDETCVVKLVKHRTVACTLNDAWEELNMPDNVSMDGAIQGHHEFMDNMLRKPTYDELAKIAGLK
jgi:hypothetical protein